MKSKVLWALAALNVLLLVGLFTGFGRTNTANAQVAGLRPGDYILIPGEVQGGTAALVYIIDTTNRVLSARSYIDTGKNGAFQDMPPINLDRVFDVGQAGGAGGAPVRPR